MLLTKVKKLKIKIYKKNGKMENLAKKVDKTNFRY